VNRRMRTGGAVALGLSLTLAVPSPAGTVEPDVLHASDFNQGSPTPRTTGHYEVEGSRLHV
jgi:hypothetical protein